MGKEYHCDLCRTSVPMDTALQEIVIGGDKVGEVCLTCGSQIKQGIKNQVIEAAAKLEAARAATQAPAPPAEQPPAPATPPPAQPAAPQQPPEVPKNA